MEVANRGVHLNLAGFTYDIKDAPESLVVEFQALSQEGVPESFTPIDQMPSVLAIDEQIRQIDSRISEVRDEKIVALGDKLSNMRAIARDYNSEGEVFWDRFRVKEKSVHGWRYHALLDAFAELSDTYAYQEFDFLVNRIFPTD